MAAMHISLGGDTIPQRNYKMIQNMASLEIAELKDSLAYAEFQLAKVVRDKERLEKDQTTHNFKMREVEGSLAGAENDKNMLKREISSINEKLKFQEDEQATVSNILCLNKNKKTFFSIPAFF